MQTEVTIVRLPPRFHSQPTGRRSAHFFFREEDRRQHEADMIRREARERAAERNNFRASR